MDYPIKEVNEKKAKNGKVIRFQSVREKLSSAASSFRGRDG